MGKRKMTTYLTEELEAEITKFRTACEKAIESIRNAGEEYARNRSKFMEKNRDSLEKESFEDERLIEPSEAAEFVGKGKAYLYQLTHRNAIPYVKRGRHLYFRKKDLRDWMMGRKGDDVIEVK